MVFSDPCDTAAVIRPMHNAPGRETRDKRLRDAPLPRGSTLIMRIPRSETLDQDRLHLGRADATAIDRVWGLVVQINPEVGTANSDTPDGAHVVIRYTWLGAFDKCMRSPYKAAASVGPRSPECGARWKFRIAPQIRHEYGPCGECIL